MKKDVITMMKRVIILGLIACSLLVVSTYSVGAVDEKKTFPPDPEDDVLDIVASDEEGVDVYTDEKPNIDIIKLEYSKEGKEVTITMEVKGKIEDKGTLDIDLDSDELDDFILYGITLGTTSGEAYNIEYVKEECELNGEKTGITWKKVGNSVLSFSFGIASSDEKYFLLEAATFEYSEPNMYSDDFYDESVSPIADAGGPYTGEVGENISFSGSALGGVSPYTYSWDFGDGTESDLQDPEHSYEEAGTYTATLTVTDDDGSTGTDTTTVTISVAGSTNGDSDSGSGLTMFIVLIAVIVVAGVAVLVYVIRR